MFMVCAMALVVRVDRGVEDGGSILQKYAKPAPKAAIPTAPAKTPSPATNSTPATQQTPPPAPQPKP
jgi:hypothetical protein